MAGRPASTYRLQIRPGFDLDAAAHLAGYLSDLGVGWAYLSPILQAATGSEHGYDVVDPTRVDAARGGPEALARFAAAARRAGLGVLVDIVPNHVGVAVPMENPWWWDVLTRGRASRWARTFDIDWDFGGGGIGMPVLGMPLDDVLAAREVRVVPPGIDAGVDAAAPFGHARYYDLVLPLAEGTAPAASTDDPAVVHDVLERQHWRLAFWQDEAAVLNYRRFFTITTLAGVRVEDPVVLAASHAEVLRWFREGLVDGVRIDHPDGLADPGGYLAELEAAVPGDAPYVVVEKILERGEELPGWWATEGTTGYDALAEIDRVLVDPDGAARLDELDAALRRETGLPVFPGWQNLIHETKREVATTAQAAEVARLVRCLPPVVRDGLGGGVAADALAELLASFPVYRSYLPAGHQHIAHAVADATARRPDLADALTTLARLVADGGLEFSRRFMQTTGPVMAKGVEDAAFYRSTRLTSLNEVGGDPSEFALDVAGLHAAFSRRQSAWPAAMTALTTHDTKRSEDVRARLHVLAEVPGRWADVLGQLREIASTGHGPFDSLLWQAIVGAWPAAPGRLHAYAIKAAREAGERTGWAAPDAEFEECVHDVVVAAHGRAVAIVNGFAGDIRAAGWSNSLAAKLLQLTGPGVPDVYQGSELWDFSLVDPDNRRPVDFARRRRLLADLDGGTLPPVDDTGAAKLLVTSRALRLRRDRPGLFTRYTPMTVVGEAAAHAVAFDRGGALTVATRLPVGLAARGGWGDTVLLRHAGPTVDALTGRTFTGSEIPLADLLSLYPVALLTEGVR
ncbi:malto-oligosyltrehalose synthase [Microbacterium invictum]|uniref:(1->4)-alpha-D-glucan 1-alpha-D-glucosylmutase n=1 Tax=Microbacterium invictum TaxID=515415 RepID=A0AA40SPV2_9MICO|nr:MULTISPECIES: malto-oligosyltrehalose synthase [Microbacterium]MBB4140215.1 (1->4)-alpha-D-glucan 1-alpha-D-glucosylmutase [Microbacterium invictum]